MDILSIFLLSPACLIGTSGKYKAPLSARKIELARYNIGLEFQRVNPLFYWRTDFIFERGMIDDENE